MTSSASGLLKSHLPRACQEMEQNAGRRVILYQLPMKTDWRLFSEGRVHILRNTRLPWMKIKEPMVIQQNTPHVQTLLNYCKPKMYVNGWVPEDTSCWRLSESVILQCYLVNSISTCNSCSVWRPLNRFWKVTGRSYICDAVVGYVSTSMDTDSCWSLFRWWWGCQEVYLGRCFCTVPLWLWPDTETWSRCWVRSTSSIYQIASHPISSW